MQQVLIFLPAGLALVRLRCLQLSVCLGEPSGISVIEWQRRAVRSSSYGWFLHQGCEFGFCRVPCLRHPEEHSFQGSWCLDFSRQKPVGIPCRFRLLHSLCFLKDLWEIWRKWGRGFIGSLGYSLRALEVFVPCECSRAREVVSLWNQLALILR